MLDAFLSTVAAIVAEAALATSVPVAIAASPEPPAPETRAERAVPEEPGIASGLRLGANALDAEASIGDETVPASLGAAPVFADRSDAEVADMALRYLESLTTLKGDFVQTAPNGAVVTGKFYLRRPGQVRFDYDDPSPITIVATGGLVYVENADLETTDSYPLKKTPLRFLLSKTIDLGDAALKSVERAQDQIALTYASNDEEADGEITLVLDAPELAIDHWAIRDPQGGVTVVALSGVVSGASLENRLFRAPEAGGAFINK